MSTTIRLATRGSTLALLQTELVVVALRAAGVRAEPVVVETAGDLRRDVPIRAIGGQGVFVKEVDAAVLAGAADASVHSAKDLPSSSPRPAVDVSTRTVTAAGPVTTAAGELPIAAFLPRSDARDALVGEPLGMLRAGAKVATGSVRRRAQLAWLRPDLNFEELRGNIGSRLDKVPPGGAVVVAMAALVRLGLADRAAQVLTTREMLPQVGQGAIAVCCRPGDDDVLSMLAAIDDSPSRAAVTAERAWLRATGGGCDLPVGAHATVGAGGALELEAMIASLDGHVVVRERRSGDDPEALGAALAESMLFSGGGRALLEPSVGALLERPTKGTLPEPPTKGALPEPPPKGQLPEPPTKGALLERPTKGPPFEPTKGPPFERPTKGLPAGEAASPILSSYESRPLFGWKVAVTRARQQASQLAAALAAAGATPVEVPTIAIDDPSDGGVALRRAAGNLGRYDWVIFTSANSVERLLAEVGDAGAFGTARVAAIGDGTARALSERGIVADLVPETFVAEALAEALPDPGRQGERVLLPRAAVARDVLPAALREKGYEVEIVEAYRTVRPPVGAALKKAVAGCRAVMFSSSSTVTGWLELLGREALPPVVVCIGPITAKTARGAGIEVAVEASVHSIDGLVEALVAHARG